MDHKYSTTTDLIYPTVLLSRYKDLPDDLVDISDQEVQIHTGNVVLPNGKQRKKHVHPFEFEDAPQPTPEQLLQQAGVTRDAAIDVFHSVVTLDNVEFDADEKALGNINRAIRFAENNGLPETTEQEWRLADNTWRPTSVAEIRQIKLLVEKAIDGHFQSVWSQFTAWDNGPKDKPFVVV